MLKHSLLSKIDKCIRHHINGWNGKIIDIQQRIEEMAYFVSFSQIFNIESTSSAYDLLMSKFNKLTLGTIQVIFETSRLASVVNGVLRKTVEDVELNGMCLK
ncbi:hypothetical protein POM88_018017 [Heracleum sosnowskyi]|uniref:Uncharacterized protein n=1 Tax=Heracleum sosnowskyi TaxID=360622 RepID=A0AAD8MYI2_9APIA|nr:hypothetical protein POM88_018017 [Heracleum sosnowskyi]